MRLRMIPMAAAIFAIDRASKYWVVEVLDLKTMGEMEVFPPYLNFVMAWNRGVNFGILNLGDDGRWALIALACAIIAGVLWWTWNARGWFIPGAVALVIGGALGNVYDRIVYGAVADFLNMSCCGFYNPFAFNVADIAIFLGAAMLIFFGDRHLKET